MGTLTLGSLFDGSGGFPLGGILAGIKPVWASEIEPFPIRVTTKRLPLMKHYGDVNRLDGGKLEPVDIITFGSPCTDLSIAGKREGLEGKQSGLFHQAIRVIKEMRKKTNARYPRFIVWENVPGAFSSHGGDDFQRVLEEICGICDDSVSVPGSAKWEPAGCILGDGFSVAWRVLDADAWGVPQRRKRIYLVGHLTGHCAGKVLFESEGVSGYSAEGFRSWQRTAGHTEGGAGETGGGICLNDQGGNRMDVTHETTATLRAEAHHPPLVMSAGFCADNSMKTENTGYEDEKAPILRAVAIPAAIYENHSQDTRYTGPLETAPTVLSRYGTGGNNQPLVVENDTAQKLNTIGCCEVTYSSSKASYHTKFEKNMSPTLVASDYKDPVTVSFGIGRDAYNMGQNAKFGMSIEKDVQPTLTARGPGAVGLYYAVRRLTPTECARLQGFPDWWCSNLETPEPTDEEICFWMDVFETHRKVMGTAKKARTRNQVIKWLKNPHTDSAEYKMWGNGVALPCVFFVVAGIAYYCGET